MSERSYRYFSSSMGAYSVYIGEFDPTLASARNPIDS